MIFAYYDLTMIFEVILKNISTKEVYFLRFNTLHAKHTFTIYTLIFLVHMMLLIETCIYKLLYLKII